jgi:cyclopropane fatty-acyl-phospholipid synthase-like methyltransferase
LRPYAVENHPTLTALGLEMQSDVVKMANANLKKWGVDHRAHVEHCDVRHYNSNEKYEIVTLHNNIYYFPVNQWLDVLRQVASLVNENGKLLVTTLCRGRSLTAQLIDLFCAATEGCGRLPDAAALNSLLLQAGFTSVYKKSLAPGEDFYMFVATK